MKSNNNSNLNSNHDLKETDEESILKFLAQMGSALRSKDPYALDEILKELNKLKEFKKINFA
jgi:hypothetical protein